MKGKSFLVLSENLLKRYKIGILTRTVLHRTDTYFPNVIVYVFGHETFHMHGRESRANISGIKEAFCWLISFLEQG